MWATSRRLSVGVVAIPTIVAAVAGSLGIAADPLWYDELFTSDASSRGISGVLDHLWEFPTVPYTTLILGWTLSGQLDADWWLRMPSLIAAGVATAFTARSGSLLGGPRVGFLAGMVVAINPLVIRYAQEGRPYAVGTALAALSLWLAVRWKLQPRRSTWFALILAVLSLAVFFAPGLVVLLPLGVFLLSNGGASELRSFLRWRDVVFTLLGVFVLLSFTGFAYLDRGEVMHGWLETPSFADLPSALGMLGFSIGTWLLFIPLLTREGSLWLFGVVLGGLGIWIVSQMGSSWWLSRSFITLTLPFALALAFVAGRASWTQVLVGISLLAVLTLPPVIASNLQREEGRNEADAAIALASIADRGDVVIVQGQAALGFALDRYAEDLKLDIRTTVDPGSSNFYSPADIDGYRCRSVETSHPGGAWWYCVSPS